MIEAPNVAAIAAAVSQLLFLIVALVVGARLLQLSYRARQLPPLLLGVNFLLGSGVGYGLNVLAILAASARGDGEVAPGASFLAVAGGFFSNLGVTAVVVFVYQVFRRGESWARVTAWLVGVWLWVVYLVPVLRTGNPLARGVWWWLYFAAFCAVALWAIAEAFLYYALMRRRLRLGLADPVLANRFLLWGTGGLFALAMGVLGATLSQAEAGPDTSLVAMTTVSLIAVLGIACVLCYWLTFFPTRSYVGFLKRRYHGTTTVGGLS